MGCTSSKLDSEDTVRRCRDRRRLIKLAVHSRHHLAAAHSDYLRALRLTGSALSSFASFHRELSVSPHLAPPVLLRPQSSPSVRVHDHLPETSQSHSSPRVKNVPHIVSESVTTVTPEITERRSRISERKISTPSEASSAWDWEKFYPPSPPTSEYFDQLRKERFQKPDLDNGDPSEDDHLREDEEKEDEEQIRCSGWRDRFSSSSSSSVRSLGHSERDLTEDEEDTRSELTSAARSDFGSFVNLFAADRRKDESGMSTITTSDDRESAFKLVVRHRDLKEIVNAVEEYFGKSATAGEEVSDLLETGRAQFDRSFRQLRKTVYHSNNVFSNLSATLTSKPPLAIRYRLDDALLEDPSSGGDVEKTSHFSTLERLLSWEKKLYKEVKDREGVKIEHERKISTLQSLEKRGRMDERMEKTKASIAKLQSQIMVTSQAASTTSAAIIKVRDNELAPQLLRLCIGFSIMWRKMNQLHEAQSHIVQQVRGLVNHSLTAEPTSALLRQATKDLESATALWHSTFSLLMKHHHDYIHSLSSWLHLTRFPVAASAADDHFSSLAVAELVTFCEDWKAAVDRVPAAVASEAIKSFVAIVHSISLKQEQELKIRKKLQALTKELEKKTHNLRSIEKKYYQSYSAVGIGIVDGSGGDPLAEKRAEVAMVRRRVEEETGREVNAGKATRELTVSSIQTGLPGLFQAVTGFSGLLAEALEEVCQRCDQC